MKYIQSAIIVLIIIIASSCRKDFTTVASFGSLEFSKDTVFLDTIFTNIGSATYNLKVYNKSNKAITIPQISLENGENSNYRLNVDGIPGKSFEDIDILANDSIFVFIETTIDFSTITDPLYTDKLLFDNGNNQQDVDLITLVQDATFIFPGRSPITMEIDAIPLDQNNSIQGRYLTDEELIFTNEKPYVIYGFAAVPTNKTLTIEAGAKLNFHNNSGLIIEKNATLKVNGTINEKIIFEGDRIFNGDLLLEGDNPDYSTTPGQWGTIWLRAGSRDNEINHAEIKNALIGILIDSIGSNNEPTLKITNSEIYDNSNFGILGRETNIEANNLVIGSAGEASFAGTFGGTYNFTHCTFANYWNGTRALPAVLVNNFIEYTDENGQDIIETRNLNAANFSNCIVEGNNNVEFLIDIINSGDAFNYNINNCLLKFNDFNNSFENNNQIDFEDVSHYQNNIINGTPDFKDTETNEFIIGENSDAVNKATTSSIIIDILGVNRISSPDIGAYQHILLDEE